jgi:hypothetical protein
MVSEMITHLRIIIKLLFYLQRIYKTTILNSNVKIAIRELPAPVLPVAGGVRLLGYEAQGLFSSAYSGREGFIPTHCQIAIHRRGQHTLPHAIPNQPDAIHGREAYSYTTTMS